MTGEWASAFADYAPRQVPWCDYLASEGGRALGSGGFKAPPDAEGVAEIGYLTFVDERGRGIAKGIAGALVELGRSLGLSGISAQTLAQENASTAVLRSHGFVMVGIIDDPDDGELWRWELRLQ